jgi:teichuronic acid exporter
MLQLYCLNIFIVAAGHTPIALFKKNLDFNLSAQSEVAFVVLSNMAKVFFAWQGLGALCFPLGDIIGNIVKTAVLFYYSDFRPRFNLFSREKAKDILSFGGYTSLTSLGSYVANQTDKLLVSGTFALNRIGFYNFGYTQSGLYFNLIQVSQTSVLLSLFAKFKQDHAAARAAVLKITSLVNFLALPVYVYGIIEAELIIRVVFTEKWLPAVIFFQLFSLDYLFRTFFTGVTGIQISFGLAKAAARVKIVNSLVFVFFLVGATFFESLEVYALCYFLGTVATALINLIVNGRVIGLRIGIFFLNFVPNLSVITASTLVYLLIQRLLDPAPGIGSLIMSALCFALLYLAFSYLLNRKVLNQAIYFAIPQKKAA